MRYWECPECNQVSSEEDWNNDTKEFYTSSITTLTEAYDERRLDEAEFYCSKCGEIVVFDKSCLVENKIIYVRLDDWEGVYINDNLIYEGHKLPSIAWYELGQSNPKIRFDEIKVVWLNDKYREEYGNLHNKFSDIPKEYFKEEK